MKFSKRTTETIWLTSSLGFMIGCAAIGGPGLIIAVLWAAFVYHCAQCLYRLGFAEGRAAGRDDALREFQEEACRQLEEQHKEEQRKLAEMEATELAIWKAVADSIRESLKTQTMVVRNPNYHEKN